MTSPTHTLKVLVYKIQKQKLGDQNKIEKTVLWLPLGWYKMLMASAREVKFLKAMPRSQIPWRK